MHLHRFQMFLKPFQILSYTPPFHAEASLPVTAKNKEPERTSVSAHGMFFLSFLKTFTTI